MQLSPHKFCSTFTRHTLNVDFEKYQKGASWEGNDGFLETKEYFVALDSHTLGTQIPWEHISTRRIHVTEQVIMTRADIRLEVEKTAHSRAVGALRALAHRHGTVNFWVWARNKQSRAEEKNQDLHYVVLSPTTAVTKDVGCEPVAMQFDSYLSAMDSQTLEAIIKRVKKNINRKLDEEKEVAKIKRAVDLKSAALLLSNLSTI